MSRLAQAVPASRVMLERSAQRGQNIGSLVANLLELLEMYGPALLEDAVTEANVNERVGASPVRLALQARVRAQGRTVPRPVEFSDQRLRDIVVEPNDLSLYDTIAEDSDDEDS